MYQLLFTLNRSKGIQVHVYDQQEDFIYLLYLNSESIQSMKTIPNSLKKFLFEQQKEIKSGKYMLESYEEVETLLG